MQATMIRMKHIVQPSSLRQFAELSIAFFSNQRPTGLWWPKLQGIDQSKLVPLLEATIQELEARIVELEPTYWTTLFDWRYLISIRPLDGLWQIRKKRDARSMRRRLDGEWDLRYKAKPPEKGGSLFFWLFFKLPFWIFIWLPLIFPLWLTFKLVCWSINLLGFLYDIIRDLRDRRN